uniref:Uncharacterized protein n=1 Tax=Anguilla anguilla TaxID=7936 RepID=A0A0E9PKD3_ANGAN
MKIKHMILYTLKIIHCHTHCKCVSVPLTCLFKMIRHQYLI